MTKKEEPKYRFMWAYYADGDEQTSMPRETREEAEEDLKRDAPTRGQRVIRMCNPPVPHIGEDDIRAALTNDLPDNVTEALDGGDGCWFDLEARITQAIDEWVAEHKFLDDVWVVDEEWVDVPLVTNSDLVPACGQDSCFGCDAVVGEHHKPKCPTWSR